MQYYPKVKRVEPLPDKRLRVTFDNGIDKVYDCTPPLKYPVFQGLKDEPFFLAVHADLHGYGLLWDDEVDLAESELWLNGIPERLPFVDPLQTR